MNQLQLIMLLIIAETDYFLTVSKNLRKSKLNLIYFLFRESWNLKRGNKYFYTRNNSALVAFTIGEKYDHKTGCFKIVGAHTDSPNLRFAPNSYKENLNYEQVNFKFINIINSIICKHMEEVFGKHGLIETYQ